MKLSKVQLTVLVVLALGSGACGKSNNATPGRVEAVVGGHVVIVTNCYPTDIPRPERKTDAATGESIYTFAPCRDAVVEIRGHDLSLNGRPEGTLKDGDVVVVDHGRVAIIDHDAAVRDS